MPDNKKVYKKTCCKYESMKKAWIKNKYDTNPYNSYKWNLEEFPTLTTHEEWILILSIGAYSITGDEDRDL